MDKKEHLTDKEFDGMLEEGFDFEDVIGQKVSFIVEGIREDGRWNVEAEADFSLSVDGIQWANKRVPVTTTDDDYDSALATAMLALANAINSPKFLASLRKELDAYISTETKDIQ
jgi:hypothetical protein